MIICEEKYPEILDKIAVFLTSADIELVFVNSNQMQNINKNERGINKTTDVLSFPLEAILHFPIGCIVINMELVTQKSLEFSHSENEEMALLFIHGMLHILGFDHEKDSGQMRQKEREIIDKFNLPKSLIIRAEES